MKNFDTKLYFITDSTGFEKAEFLHRVEEALEGGATILQLREKNKSTMEYIELAEKVHELTKKYNVPLIIDDRIDVALAVGAEGVHLGKEDMPIATARKILGDDFIIGATAKTVPWVLESVHVKIHLVVGAEPVVVDSQHGHLSQHIVDRGHCDLGCAFLFDLFCDHVCTGMTESHHRLVYR